MLTKLKTIGRVDVMVVDLPSLDKVQVYLLSQPRLVPLVVLASPPELNSQRLREMVGLYAPLHVVPLPLSQQVTSLLFPFFFHFLLQASPHIPHTRFRHDCWPR